MEGGVIFEDSVSIQFTDSGQRGGHWGEGEEAVGPAGESCAPQRQETEAGRHSRLPW